MATLSPRLRFIASFVEKGMHIADIGSDHGYLPLYLLEKGIVPFAYACENKEGPYRNLLATFRANASDRIVCAYKDGLEDLPETVDTVILTGMGGELIMKILSRGSAHLRHVEWLILSPQMNLPEVRHYINAIGYAIVDEGMIEDDKFYTVIKARRGFQRCDENECRYGPILLKERPEAFLRFLEQRRTYLLKLLREKELSRERESDIARELEALRFIMEEAK